MVEEVLAMDHPPLRSFFKTRTGYYVLVEVDAKNSTALLESLEDESSMTVDIEALRDATLGFAKVDCGNRTVLRNGQDICLLFGDHGRQVGDAAGPVRHDDVDIQQAAVALEAAFKDTGQHADIDIAAADDHDDLFAQAFYFIV